MLLFVRGMALPQGQSGFVVVNAVIRFGLPNCSGRPGRRPSKEDASALAPRSAYSLRHGRRPHGGNPRYQQPGGEKADDRFNVVMRSPAFGSLTGSNATVG